MGNKEKYKSAAKGISIAIIVVSSIAILINLIAIIYLIIAFNAAQSSETIVDIANSASSNSDIYIKGQDLIIGQSSISLFQLTNIGLSLMLGFSLFSLLTAGYGLFISIFTLINSLKNKMSKAITELNILNIVTSFLSFSFIRLILSITITICLSKARKNS